MATPANAANAIPLRSARREGAGDISGRVTVPAGGRYQLRPEFDGSCDIRVTLRPMFE